MLDTAFVDSDQSSCYEVSAFWKRRPDQELLRLFVEEQNGIAFAAIVHRHGSMVLGVCRRVLRNVHDAEDAFQAAFMVLVHKASSMRDPKLLSSWLHGVALRTAQHCRARDLRRAEHERKAAKMSSMESWESPSRWEELRERIDAELHALPEKYRAPLILCYLEGKTNAEAARMLGWPEGSISARVARGRDLLRRRLAGRDQELYANIFPFLFGCSIDRLPLPSLLVNDTVAAALAALPDLALITPAAVSAVSALSESSSCNPDRARSRGMLKVFMTVLVVLLGFGAVAYGTGGRRYFGTYKAALPQSGATKAVPHSCH